MRRGNRSPYRLSPKNRQALLLQMHQDIDEIVQSVLASALTGSINITYPPNETLTDEEKRAIISLSSIPHFETALGKVVADAASFPVWRFLEYIDGVADPDASDWTGVCLVDRLDDLDEDVGGMLHDDFYEAYWEWKEVMR